MAYTLRVVTHVMNHPRANFECFHMRLIKTRTERGRPGTEARSTPNKVLILYRNVKASHLAILHRHVKKPQYVSAGRMCFPRPAFTSTVLNSF